MSSSTGCCDPSLWEGDNRVGGGEGELRKRLQLGIDMCLIQRVMMGWRGRGGGYIIYVEIFFLEREDRMVQ